MTLLTDTQRRVVDAALHRESMRRRHVVVALSGAHAYGFPSPDSDLDLKAIHLAPTRHVLGLHAPEEHADFMETVEGVELDYTSNELGPVLRGILLGNGNYLERVLGACTLRTSAEHEELRPLVAATLSRRVHRHYRGFAGRQYAEVRRAERPTAKRVLYVLRTALTGTHLLQTGRLVVDVTELLDTYGLGEARDLVERKRAGEQTELDAAATTRWVDALGSSIERLDAAYERSVLPVDPPGREALDDWLVQARCRLLQECVGN